MRIKSLSDKIVLYFVIIGITAIAVVSTYSFFTSKIALLNRTFDQLTSVRVVKKNQIEQFFNDRLGELSLLSNTSGALDFTEKNIKHIAQIDISLEDLLKHLESGGYYTGFYIEMNNGIIAFYDFKNTDPHSWKFISPDDLNPVVAMLNENQFSHEFIIHDYLIDYNSGDTRMFISGPLFLNGKTSDQRIALEISIDVINAIMLAQNPNDGLGLSGESYLVGNDQLMRSSSRFQQYSIMATKVSTTGVKEAYNDHFGTSIITDYRGVKVLSSYSKIDIPGLNWVILAEIDYSEATKSIYAIRNNILILTIFVALIVFLISYIFSKRITQPLIQLTEATANIQSGNLDVNIPLITHDEIGQLTDSFNQMAASLKEKDSELMLERNKRFTAMIDGQELERQRLSRELHDGLGQSLIALKLKLEAINSSDVCGMNKNLKEVKISFDGTINEIRRISNDLMPAVLSEFGLITALKNIADEISENSNINFKVTYKGRYNDLNNRVSIYLFRIIQEATNNIVKHADASEAGFELIKNSNSIQVMIEDNGKGFDIAKTHRLSGNGIHNMRERIRLLQGKLEIKSQAGKGTLIKIDIPLNKNTNGKN
jgi:signal transduction histidine kinase